MAILTHEAMLTRDKAATSLSEHGYPISKLTLQTKASRGGGPVYRRFGKRVLYRWGDLLDWAEACCSTPRRSTSEADEAAPKGIGTPAEAATARTTEPAPLSAPKFAEPTTDPPAGSRRRRADLTAIKAPQ
jgi:hypothetical protein